MNLSPDDLRSLSTLATKAATKAGTMIAKRANDELSVKFKEGGSSKASQVFTEVDIESERIILNTLKPSLYKYDLALLSEESTDDQQRFTKAYFWCIDPLDGTLPFIEQSNGYSVSIALVKQDGTPVIGVIYDPITSAIYSAIINQGAYKNGNKWTMVANNDKELTLVCDRSFLKQTNYNEIKNQLQKYTQEKLHIISHGGAAMNAMWVAENQPSVYFKRAKKSSGGGSIWDYAASACIFKELNAYACNYKGKRLDLNRKASTFMNHEGIFYCSSKVLAKQIQLLL